MLLDIDSCVGGSSTYGVMIGRCLRTSSCWVSGMVTPPPPAVTPGRQVAIRIAVADASDSAYDSAVALIDGGIYSERAHPAGCGPRRDDRTSRPGDGRLAPIGAGASRRRRLRFSGLGRCHAGSTRDSAVYRRAPNCTSRVHRSSVHVRRCDGSRNCLPRDAARRTGVRSGRAWVFRGARDRISRHSGLTSPVSRHLPCGTSGGLCDDDYHAGLVLDTSPRVGAQNVGRRRCGLELGGTVGPRYPRQRRLGARSVNRSAWALSIAAPRRKA